MSMVLGEADDITLDLTDDLDRVGKNDEVSVDDSLDADFLRDK